MNASFLTDPLWYKDAVIYELHVRSFFDANNDGYGDFRGLRAKLAYLESLSVNTLWLLPFLESPLKDDGYDTADYYKVLGVHGSIDEFKAFLDEAHDRGMRVITELVLNHTSDQHHWFQEARNPSSPRHDWYVWSDSPDKYRDARIIFTDTEVSNWSWDRKAGRYYWHRFFSHQPDLNYDNPDVREAMTQVTFHWLDMGVDGLRLDAVPYLFEREGTSCENLPETIDFLRQLRAAIEARYGPGKILLAEANQWPEDTLPYFADGKGVQMAFNFPIMPRLYMSLRRENRGPLVSMLEMTENIPDDCQWAIFLRNHDELTLEMVTDEERDYLYHEYATDSRFRINVGIRRRLMPLLEADRRRVELLNALLLSLRGSPVIYYGDEIGMGDDPFLGDRNGVRTPMQWSPDRNGGFSRAPSYRLFMPTIASGPYSYEFVNVEDSASNPHSLLAFSRRLLALRGQYASVFGRGSFRVLPVENQAVLAFVREHEGRRLLVIANLSRFCQATRLPADGLEGAVPIELFSRSHFPEITPDGWPIMLGPFGFYWFALQEKQDVGQADIRGQITSVMVKAGEIPQLSVQEGLQNLLVRTMVRDQGQVTLEKLLVNFIPEQRWFGAKERTIVNVRIDDAVRIQASPDAIYLSILQVDLGNEVQTYVLPLMLSFGDVSLKILEERPGAALAWVDGPGGRGLLHDATAGPSFWSALFRWWKNMGKARSLKGTYSTLVSDDVMDLQGTDVRVLSSEQSNSSAIIDGRVFMKLYRHLQVGVNPEVELLEYITQQRFRFVPRLEGVLVFKRPDKVYHLGILQQALPVESDGWEYTRNYVRLFMDRVPGTSLPTGTTRVHHTDSTPTWVDELAPEVLALARLLGVRTAEMHTLLADADIPAMKSDVAGPDETRAYIQQLRDEAEETRKMIEAREDFRDALPAAHWDAMFDRLDRIAALGASRCRIRIHGDYHLGQVIRADGEFYILDFEGEPKRHIEERRLPGYALRDVAGMLRSFEYAGLSVWKETHDGDETLLAWVNALAYWCETTFLTSYFGTAGSCDYVTPIEAREEFLWLHLIEKALYEVRYELSHRPDWTWLPVTGLQRLMHPDRNPF